MGHPQSPADTAVLAAFSTEREKSPAAYFRRVAKLGIQAAEALHHAHELGIIHRDIKPANLLLDASGKLWITDFGLARIEGADNLTLTGDLLGTLRYMSPEQASGHKVGIDHRTDIYSLGATLYELLTLQPAVIGQNRQELLRQITDAEPRPPRRHNAAIPADLEKIILKSLAKESRDRYTTAGEFAADFKRLITNQPVLARRPSRLRRIVKWSQRNQAIVITTALSLFILTGAVGAILGWWARDREAQHQMITQLRQDAAKTHRELGIVLHDQLKLDRAITEFKKPVELQPDIALHHRNLGTALMSRGESLAAVPAFRKAIELNPNDAVTHNNLGATLQALGELDEASAEFRKAIELNPNYQNAHFGLGVVLGSQGKLDEATAQFRTAARLRPQHFEAHVNLGFALLSQGQFADALAAFQRAQELHLTVHRESFPVADFVQEAQQLLELDARLPAVITGEAQPENARETIGFATVCRYKRLHVTAAGLYTQAFARDPSPVEQPGDDSHAYCAARCALLGASGKGLDSALLTGAERVLLRDQAHQWLSAELGRLQAWLMGQDASHRKAAVATLQQWQRDPDLSSVRDAAEVVQLPQAEKMAWAEFWSAVARQKEPD